MDKQPQTASPPPSSPDKTQDRADILESNLYNAISKQNNPVVLQFQIDRTTSKDPVIVKALVQLFPRLNIKIPQILAYLRRLLMQKIPEGKELKLNKQVLSLSDKGPPETAHLGITLRAFVSAQKLAVEIKGVPPVPSKDGAIKKAFFDYESCPGAFKQDGSIDFKEINKYPIVKAGDNLFLITPEVQGRVGMQYDGRIIHVPQAQPLAIALNGGVDAVDSMAQDGKLRGHFLRASRTGAVLLSKANGKITGIEIRNALDIKRLDYSTGNIGTNFVCPISMKIDTICNDFRIRAKGMVEVGELEGGHVETESSAKIYSALARSSVKAEKDVVVHLAKSSILSSLNGHVIIVDESLDCKIDGRGVTFDKYKGILTNSTLDAEHINLKNIFLCGSNTIHFGTRLFNQKAALVKGRAELKEHSLSRKEKQDQLTASLHEHIRALSKILKNNPLLRDNLKAFILATQAMDYTLLYSELDTIAQTMNTKEVEFIRKNLGLLKKMPEMEKVSREKDRALVRQIAQAEHDMDKMTLGVEGLMRRAATIKVFTPDPDKENPNQPDLFLENQSEKDLFIKIHGNYNRNKGFTVIRL